jgi:hypothetical protein
MDENKLHSQSVQSVGPFVPNVKEFALHAEIDRLKRLEIANYQKQQIQIKTEVEKLQKKVFFHQFIKKDKL